jgi:membrane fusion protein, multidrug efflux system
MNKRIKIAIILITFLAVILSILFFNKSRLDASTERISMNPSTVSVARAVRQAVQLQLNTVGVLQAYSDVPVIAETQGKVLQCYVHVGDYVHAGTPILKVDTLLKYAAFVAAKTAYAKAELDLARFKSLHEQNNVSSNDLELATLNFRSAEAQYFVAKRQYEDAVIRAPIAGEIAEHTVHVGMMVAPGASVATIVDVSRLKTTIAVAENKIARIKKGMQVSIALATYPGVRFYGTVKYIGPKASDALLFPVEIQVPNNNQYPLRAGMTAAISINEALGETALLIPRVALLGSSRQGKVYVIENNCARLRSVAVRDEVGELVEIVSGLREGESVVTIGTNTIRDGAQVLIQ